MTGRFKRGLGAVINDRSVEKTTSNPKRMRTASTDEAVIKNEDNRSTGGPSINNRKRGRSHRPAYNDKRQRRNKASRVSFKKLNEWSLKETSVVVIELIIHKVGFEELLEGELSNDAIVLILQILAKVYLSAFRENKNEIINVMLKGTFLSNLKTFIMQLPLQEKRERERNSYFWNDVNGFFNNVILICKYLIETMPSRACEILPKTLKAVILTVPNFESEQSVEVSDDIKKRFSELEEALTLCQVELERKKEVTNQQVEEAPPNDFRQLSIYPTSDEITTSKRAFVRKNVIDGPYTSVEHYLDVQFRLLKEDFVAPLRQGVHKYIRCDKGRSNVKIHAHVEFISPWLTKHQQLGAVLQFNMKAQGQKKYKFLKRFMYGSLVCFTKDNFATIIFGKIIERTLEFLNKGQVVVGFAPGFNSYELDQPYIMVECNVYFEPYYQVLKALQNTYESTFPMKKYIVDVDTNVESPDYLNEGSTLEIGNRNVSVFDPKSWPTAVDLDLDDTQFAAFRAAITQKLAVIQGPPGTGKTYLGLTIVKTLIKNKHFWRQNGHRPILVVCYTNHALDQFLEGLIGATDDIVRVGAQSKNAALEEFNLKAKRRNTSLLSTNRQRGSALGSLKVELGILLRKIKDWNENLEEIKTYQGVVHFRHFVEVEPGLATSWFATASNLELMDWLLEGDAESEPYELHLTDQEHLKQQQQENNGQVIELDEMLEAEINQEVDIDFDLVDLVPHTGEPSTPTYLLHVSDLVQISHEITEEMKKIQQFHDWDYNRELQLKLNQTENELHHLERHLRKGKASKVSNKPKNLDLQNPRQMIAVERWMLYFYWLELYQTSIVNKLLTLQTKYRAKYKQFEEIKNMEDTQIMKQMLVVGMTTSGAARLQTSLQELKCPIVIVEEAAEVLESHIIASLTSSCEHLILIGDHQQLRPSTADFRMEKDYNLGISLFERMVRNNIQCCTLGIQHRMRPEIAKLIVPAIYPVLENHELVFNYPPVVGVDRSLYFIDHDHPEEESDDTSRRNKHEVKFLINLAYYLVQNGYRPEDITILAAYSGQMFELWKERKKKELLLQDVRITVLDNYQGEESKIILLSLVRNNEDNNIGFLKIENRVCVALSRAKEGFYIMGNMNLLCQNSQIWAKVKEALESQESLGKTLALCCQIHPEEITAVQSADDFLKVPEGGCLKMCETEMACGHKCPRICHVRDRSHTNFMCKEKCTKICKNGHACQKQCYLECGPCQVIMQKTLPCSHDNLLPCFIEPEDHVCIIPVAAKLPCGHEVSNKPCFKNTETFQCPFPCDARIEPCGHSCKHKCHIRNDPDHLRYKCFKKCERFRKDCSTGTHKCPLKCFEKCPPCKILLVKLRSCFHHFKVDCSINIDETSCPKPCTKMLPCGHKCRSGCSDTCGICSEMVEKQLPVCGHKVASKCSEEPDIKKCRGQCPLTLKCGHQCKRKCCEQCTTKCTKMVEHTKTTDCGHKFKIQCHLIDTELPSNSYELLQFCREPCKATLECSHPCSGTCGDCAQGRMHKSCTEKCGVLLICGHECKNPCRDACQPCTLRCSYRCKHSACRKKCGEPCTSCIEKCERQCKHVWCKAKCGQKCTVQPCMKPCAKLLPCSHSCVGFCGDPCPNLCRVCDCEKLTEVFLGHEDEKGARFVLLNECKHIIESRGMEQWLQHGGEEISNKTCPKCKTPLSSTQRYSDYIKQAMDDVIEVKKRFFGLKEENQAKQAELKVEVAELQGNCKQLSQELPILKDLLEDFRDALEPEHKGKRQSLSKLQTKMHSSKIQILRNIAETLNKAKLKKPNIIKKINSYAKFLLRLLQKLKNRITNQEITDFERELNRFARIAQLCQIEDHPDFQVAVSSKQSLKELHQEAHDGIFSLLVFTDELRASLEEKLTTLSKELNLILFARKERQQIVRAVGLTPGHWFKCPFGHYYVIGECGGANQVGKCIECGQAVGGTNHTLLTGNRHTGELDGSLFAAWSEAANNLFNYEEFGN